MLKRDTIIQGKTRQAACASAPETSRGNIVKITDVCALEGVTGGAGCEDDGGEGDDQMDIRTCKCGNVGMLGYPCPNCGRRIQ